MLIKIEKVTNDVFSQISSRHITEHFTSRKPAVRHCKKITLSAEGEYEEWVLIYLSICEGNTILSPPFVSICVHHLSVLRDVNQRHVVGVLSSKLFIFAFLLMIENLYDANLASCFVLRSVNWFWGAKLREYNVCPLCTFNDTAMNFSKTKIVMCLSRCRSNWMFYLLFDCPCLFHIFHLSIHLMKFIDCIIINI